MSLQSLAHHSAAGPARFRREQAASTPAKVSEALVEGAFTGAVVPKGSMWVLEALVALVSIVTALLIGLR